MDVLAKWECHDRAVCAMAFSCDGSQLVSVGMIDVRVNSLMCLVSVGMIDVTVNSLKCLVSVGMINVRVNSLKRLVNVGMILSSAWLVLV